MESSKINKISFAAITLLFSSFANAVDDNVQRDSAGREVIVGPVSGGYYSNVHIVSDSVGVETWGSTTIVNSVIEAPICVQSSGTNLSLMNNVLNCDLCVKFTGSMLLNNKFVSNSCTGHGTNRPDVFGW